VPGVGVYRSTNGGDSWTMLNLSNQASKIIPTYVSKILIPPWNDNAVFVTGDDGIFRSTDNGSSWAQVLALNTSDITSATDGSYMLAGVNGQGIYKSLDQGATWAYLHEPTNLGLPYADVGRVSVAISPSLATRAYALMGKKSDSRQLGVYKTATSGSSWSTITPPPSSISGGKQIFLGQQDYNNVITIHPTDPNILWCGGVQLVRTPDGGSNWADVGATGAFPRKVHPDIHALKYINGTLYVGCDGGVFTTTDEGSTWSSSLNKMLPITQFRNIAVDPYGGGMVYGAAQDNANPGTAKGDPTSWLTHIWGDGGDAAVAPSNPDIIYITHNNPSGWAARERSTDGGASWASISKPIFDNQDTLPDWGGTYIVTHRLSNDIVYTNAGHFVYISTDQGSTWSRMNTGSEEFHGNAYSIAVNRSGACVYAITVSTSERVSKLSLEGGVWKKYGLMAGLTSVTKIKRVSTKTLGILDPTDSSRAYVITYDAGPNKIFRTTDKGATWNNITGNLQTVSLIVNDLAEIHKTKFVIGTTVGAFITTDGGTTWIPWTQGMPLATDITDLEFRIHDYTAYIVAGTYGRSIYERPVGGMDPVFSASIDHVNFASIAPGEAKKDCVMVYNMGEAELDISSVQSADGRVSVSPPSGSIQAGDSLKFLFTLRVPIGVPDHGAWRTDVEFIHNGEDSPSRIGFSGYIGDGTSFRTFSPESLRTKNEVKRKATSTSWGFSLPNTFGTRDAATALFVEFKNPVSAFSSHSPFDSVTSLEGKGKLWKFSFGSVPNGASAYISGIVTKTKSQTVKKWWWTGPIIRWEGDTEGSEEGILGIVNSVKLPDWQKACLGMPNTANFRKEIFSQVPYSRDNPMIIGVADPAAKSKKISYVTFAREGDLLGSLAPGRSGKEHNGPPRYFDSFDNGREMIGQIKKLTPDKQSNRLFADLIALRLNIVSSALEITPIGFGELKYSDPGHRLHGIMIKQIDSLANRYMTYGDSSAVGSASELDSVVHKINLAFTGPPDTISFSSKLKYDGTRAIDEVPFLERDLSIIPVRITPRALAGEAAAAFTLYQNYPNPFNPTTTIGFNLPQRSKISLRIYNTLGQEVATILDHELYDDGTYEVEFNATRLASGMYIYRLEAEGLGEEDENPVSYTCTRKMILLK